ncbi:MAG: hypothetical protein ACQ9IQ_05015 [Nitrospirales bacterium]|jgi:uncharacterized membrane protein YgcG
MQRQLKVKMVGLLGIVVIGLTGCGVWPVMTEDNGRRPFAMGKSDQLLLPWAPQPVHLSEDYGIAYRQSVEGQILNPEASRNLGPVEGDVDPKALHYGLLRYQEHFKTPPYSEFELKITTSGGSSGGGAKKSGSGGSKSSGGGKK